MHPDVELVWDQILEAWRSGNYEQGRGVLKTLMDGIPKYCCLGIAAEILGRQFLPAPSAYASETTLAYEDRESGHMVTQLSDADAEFLHLDYEVTRKEGDKLQKMFDRTMIETTRMSVLMWLNDDIKVGFPKIADVVEELEWNK